MVMGVRGDGEMEALAVEDSYREKEDACAAVLRLRDRGLNEPHPVTGAGAAAASLDPPQ